jgi:hypothetical protein
VVGFGLTIWIISQSKTAAERAEAAALKTRDFIIRSDTIALISAAVTAMNEIKRLHRVSAWNILPDRYAELRKLLISVRGSNTHLSPEYASVIQGTIQQFSTIEDEVEKALAAEETPSNQPKLNKIISRQGDKLLQMLEEMKREIGD